MTFSRKVEILFSLYQCLADFPAPWTKEEIPGRFKVVDATGQARGLGYARETKAQADVAHVLMTDEARRIAANIAKLPQLLAKKD
jgi:hypothetical protein